MAVSSKKQLAPVLAVLNMKGGVGKTTVSAHVFRELYRQLLKNTLVIDFDPQFNLTQTLVIQTRYEKLKQQNQTILSVMEQEPNLSLFGITGGSQSPPDLEDVSILMKQLGGGEVQLRLVPGDFGLVKYSLIDDSDSLNPVRERFKTFVAQAQQKMDLVCIDCNPSSSFMTVCALEVATHILVPVRPDRFSVLGLELLDKFIQGLPTLKHKPKLIVLLNGIPRSSYDPTVENILRSHPDFGPKTLSNRLYQSSILAASPSYTGFATDKKINNRYGKALSANINALAVELGKELGLKK